MLTISWIAVVVIAAALPGNLCLFNVVIVFSILFFFGFM